MNHVNTLPGTSHEAFDAREMAAYPLASVDVLLAQKPAAKFAYSLAYIELFVQTRASISMPNASAMTVTARGPLP
jgi:hypothetical protein